MAKQATQMTDSRVLRGSTGGSERVTRLLLAGGIIGPVLFIVVLDRKSVV